MTHLYRFYFFEKHSTRVLEFNRVRYSNVLPKMHIVNVGFLCGTFDIKISSIFSLSDSHV